MAGLAHHLGARIVVLVDAMAEAHQADFAVLVLHPGDEIRNLVAVHVDEAFFVEVLRIDDGAVGVGEDLEVPADADVVEDEGALGGDLRFGLRVMLRSPGVTAAATTTRPTPRDCATRAGQDRSVWNTAPLDMPCVNESPTVTSCSWSASVPRAWW